MSEEGKVLATRIVQEIWNEGNLDLTDQIIAPDNADNVAGDGSPGRTRWIQTGCGRNKIRIS